MRCAEVAWRDVTLMPRWRRVAALLGVLTRQTTEQQAPSRRYSPSPLFPPLSLLHTNMSLAAPPHPRYPCPTLTLAPSPPQVLDELLAEEAPPKYTPEPDCDLLPGETEAEFRTWQKVCARAQSDRHALP